MKLSVLANLYGSKSLEDTLQILTSHGVHFPHLTLMPFPSYLVAALHFGCVCLFTSVCGRILASLIMFHWLD